MTPQGGTTTQQRGPMSGPGYAPQGNQQGNNQQNNQQGNNQQQNNQQGQTQLAQFTDLEQTTWEELSQPGAYIEEGTGALYRVPQEALMGGASPVINRVQNNEPVLFKISDDPWVTKFQARQIAANNDIQPNF